MNELTAALNRLAPISLAELEDSAALMSRVDRKYFVPRDLLAETIAALGSHHRVLEINAVRSFRYRTVYLDTPEFHFFRQHVQQRRNRFKVRTRTYCDSGLCLLEVKSKGLRGRTQKRRIPHDAHRPRTLDATDRDFITSITGTAASSLQPVLETIYHRTTLRVDVQRITLDLDLEYREGDRCITGPQEVLVETKSPDGAGALDRMLLRSGTRPHSVSKYCMAAALLYPQLAGNDWARLLRRYWGGASSAARRHVISES